tara:strand:+ start:76 stop:486 length:411 start_codon:yes stop_codon:yes gene_type:complete
MGFIDPVEYEDGESQRRMEADLDEKKKTMGWLEYIRYKRSVENNIPTHLRHKYMGTREDDCFVATVVYGDANSPEVETLRDFRDTVLLENPLGRRFVDMYYGGFGERMAGLARDKFPSSIPLIRRGLDYIAERHSS